jgi:release factor glutamine methyltransferase
MLAGDALAQGIARLRNEGVESPRLDAELILAHLLGVNRAAVLARPDRRLTPKELTQFRDLINRRGAREPLAYVVGQREFYGLEFAVTRHVLVPRPETELLVERALWLARRLPPVLGIADVGAGSGAIAVTLAVHLPQATIYALDESEEALAVTAQNARRHDVYGRLRCLRGDLLEPLAGRQVRLITANLPYVTTAEWEQLAPEIRDYEPRAALDGGADGLSLIHRLLATAGGYLADGGALLLEIGAGQGPAVSRLARTSFPLAAVNLHQDYAGLDRILEIRT